MSDTVCRRFAARGFTLIELLVVIGILGLLVVAFAPDIVTTPEHADRAADQANLRWHYEALKTYEQSRGHFPDGGGPRWLLAPWTVGVVERTEPHFRRYWTPGIDDVHRQELLARGLDDIWRDASEITSADTHYAARRQDAGVRRIESGKVPWAANDNEGGSSFRDGTVHVLMGDRFVKTLTPDYFIERYDIPRAKLEQEGFPVGEGSPDPLLGQLEK